MSEVESSQIGYAAISHLVVQVLIVMKGAIENDGKAVRLFVTAWVGDKDLSKTLSWSLLLFLPFSEVVSCRIDQPLGSSSSKVI